MTRCVIAGGPCPQTRDPAAERYCPAWVDDLVETNVATGEQRILRDCILRHYGRLWGHVIAASSRPAASVDEMRNDIARGFALIARTMEANANDRTGRDPQLERGDRPRRSLLSRAARRLLGKRG